jgi:hypothetical protein
VDYWVYSIVGNLGNGLPNVSNNISYADSADREEWLGGNYDHYSDYRRAFLAPWRRRLLRIPSAGIAEN